MNITSYKAFKFRLYPNKKQQTQLAKTFGCVRFVYNHYLAKKIALYEDDKTNLTYNQCSADLTQLKKTEYGFLSDVDSVALQQSLRHLDTAFKNFFKNPQQYSYPRFKSKKTHQYSYTTIQGIAVVDGYLKLPKVGLVKMKQHRPIPPDYTLKSATISQTSSGKYFASLLYAYETDIQPVEPKTVFNLNFSMKNLYTDSDGDSVNNPMYYQQLEEKLKREHRKLSQMKKGSKNWEKQRIKLAKLYEKTVNQRNDFLHKQSRTISDMYDCVRVESPNLTEMKETLGFGKEISDTGWGMFNTFLEYKLQEQGKQYIKLPVDNDVNEKSMFNGNSVASKSA